MEPVDPVDPTPKPDPVEPVTPPKKALPPRASSSYILLLIVVPLLFIGLIMPCIAIKLDNSDYKNIEDDVYKLPNNLSYIYEKFMLARGSSCMEEVMFIEKDI